MPGIKLKVFYIMEQLCSVVFQRWFEQHFKTGQDGHRVDIEYPLPYMRKVEILLETDFLGVKIANQPNYSQKKRLKKCCGKLYWWNMWKFRIFCENTFNFGVWGGNFHLISNCGHPQLIFCIFFVQYFHKYVKLQWLMTLSWAKPMVI